MTDPGFTRGDANPKGMGATYYLAKLSRKRHENEENWAEGRGRIHNLSVDPLLFCDFRCDSSGRICRGEWGNTIPKGGFPNLLFGPISLQNCRKMKKLYRQGRGTPPWHQPWIRQWRDPDPWHLREFFDPREYVYIDGHIYCLLTDDSRDESR